MFLFNEVDSTDITIHKHDHDVIEDEQVTLECVTSSSSPPSSIAWFENDNPQKNNHEPVFESGDFNGTITSLKYTSTPIHRHEHKYITCCISEKKENCRKWTAHVECE